MSQADLAKALNKSRSSISEYEKGNHAPRIGVLKQIAKVTKTSLEALLA